MEILSSDQHLLSNLWLDQPNAIKEIESRLEQGWLSQEEAKHLRSFSEGGFFSFELKDKTLLEHIDLEIENLWKNRPGDTAFSGKREKRKSFSFARSKRHRKPGYRLYDLHGRGEKFRGLYLHPEIHRYAELIFAEKAIAFQSLFFEWGSEQGVHRDPMLVVVNPRSHLVAAWVALEDIREESGPLTYLPRSHRLPWYSFIAGDVVRPSHCATKEKTDAAKKYYAGLIEEKKLKPEKFTCKKGSVFFWHAGLFHGGAPITNTQCTRKSFVIHFATAANYRTRTLDMQVEQTLWRKPKWDAQTTNLVFNEGGRLGLESPLKNYPL